MSIVLSSFFGCSVHKKATKERSEMLREVTIEKNAVSKADLEKMPVPVQKWLINSGVVGQPITRSAFVTQDIKLKLKPEQENWHKASANQLFTTQKPAFNWTMHLKLSPFIRITARDKFMKGKGEMLIKMNGLIRMGRERGYKIDEGSLQRYLGEILWLPSAAIHDSIEWEPIDELTARATLQINGVEGSGTFKFNIEGDPVSFSAWRYQGNDPGDGRKLWVNTVDEMGERNGIRVPIKTTTTWKLDEGDWDWLKITIKDIKKNISNIATLK